MKIRILSDVHYDDGLNGNGIFDEIYGDKFKSADINLLAGDIAVTLEKTENFLNKYMPNQTVYMIGGNHVVYTAEHLTLDQILDKYKYKFPLTSVFYHFLENTWAFIPGTNNNIAIIGSIFYTNYEYCDYTLKEYNERQKAFDTWLEAYGLHTKKEPEAKELTKEMIIQENMLTAFNEMNDFKWGYYTLTRHLSPEDYLSLNKKAKRAVLRCYKEIMSINKDCKVILMTHHALSPKCIDQKYRGKPLNASFVSDLEKWITNKMPNVRLVVSGHVHNRFDFTFGKNKVRYICNPVGYIKYNEHTKDNPFNPNLIIDTEDL